MGAGGGIGIVGRAFGGVAARTGATLTGESISSVAARHPSASGSIGGGIADRSLSNYMPHLSGKHLSGTQIAGGQISTTAVGSNGKEASVQMYNAAMYDRPDTPHSVVKASDGSEWYQTATGAGMSGFYSPASTFTGDVSESAQVAESFPDAAEGTMLRTVDDGVMEATNPDGSNSMWYNSALYQEPDAPHDTIESSDGVSWYAMQPNAGTPNFDTGDGYSDTSSMSEATVIPDGAHGVPFDSSAHDAADFNESSTLPGGSGTAVSEETGGVMVDGSIPDGTVINDTSTLPGGSAHAVDSSGMSGGEMVDGISSEGSVINDTTTLPGGSVNNVDSISGSDAASSITVDSGVHDSTEMRDSTTLPGGSERAFNPFSSPDSPKSMHDSDAAHETTTLPGGSSPAVVSDGSSSIAVGGVAPEVPSMSDSVTIPGSTPADVKTGSESIHADSGGISISGDGKTVADLRETSTISSGTGSVHKESGHVSVDKTTDSAGVTERGLGDYKESTAPPYAASTLSGGGAPVGSHPSAERRTHDPVAAAEYNQAQFRQFMPGYAQQTSSINASRKDEGVIEVRHADGTGTAFYDKSQYKMPRGEHQLYEDNKGGKWYAVQGTPTVERRPVYENGKPVYDGTEMKTVNVEGMKYKTIPEKFNEPKKRDVREQKPPRKK